MNNDQVELTWAGRVITIDGFGTPPACRAPAANRSVVSHNYGEPEHWQRLVGGPSLSPLQLRQVGYANGTFDVEFLATERDLDFKYCPDYELVQSDKKPDTSSTAGVRRSGGHTGMPALPRDEPVGVPDPSLRRRPVTMTLLTPNPITIELRR